MFEELSARLGYMFATIQFQSQKDPPREMTDFLRGANHVLITMPIGYESAVAAGSALQKIHDHLRHARLTLVHTSTRATGLTGQIHGEVVRLDPSDVNRFSLPSRGLLQRIMTHPYDVAIDLNLDFVLHTAYICRASGASIRVGCVPDAKEIFFNVQIHPAADRKGQTIYESVASALAMF